MNEIIDAAVAEYKFNKNVVLHHIEIALEKILDNKKCISLSRMNDNGVTLSVTDLGIEAMNMALIGDQIIGHDQIIESIKDSITKSLKGYNVCVNVGVLPADNDDWSIKSLTITVYC